MSTTCFVSPRRVAIAPPGAGILRTLQVEFRPICDGRESTSLDDRFVARAMSTYGPHSSGGSKSCYAFVGEDRAGRRLQHVEIPVRRDDLINWRLEGSITWADDCSAVTFAFRRTSLTLLIDRDK
jgi:hypothetical protein